MSEDAPAYTTRRHEKIVDPCPSCCQHTIFIGIAGHLTCSNLRCPDPGVGRVIEQLKADRTVSLSRAEDAEHKLETLTDAAEDERWKVFFLRRMVEVQEGAALALFLEEKRYHREKKRQDALLQQVVSIREASA